MKHFYFIFFFLIVMGCQTTNQTPDEVINNYYRKGKFNGSILIAQNDKVILDTVFGYRDLDQKVELTKEAPFYIASLSKSFTAIAIFQLAEKGLLSFDDDAVKFDDDLPSYAHHITIKQLLNHTSGIRDYENRLTKKGLTNNDVIHWLQNQDGLDFPILERSEKQQDDHCIDQSRGCLSCI